MALSTYTHAFDPGDGRDERTLILLHGTGDNEQSFLRLGQAVAPKAAKIALRGNVHENGMARFFRRTGEGIYDMDDLALRTGQLDAFVNAALIHYGRGREQAVGVGYSNGANILANLLFENPETLPQMVLMHPLIPFDPALKPAAKGARVLVTSGACDPISPASSTDRLEDALIDAGVRLQRYRHPGGHEIRMEEVDAIQAWLGTAKAAA